MIEVSCTTWHLGIIGRVAGSLMKPGLSGSGIQSTSSLSREINLSHMTEQEMAMVYTYDNTSTNEIDRCKQHCTYIICLKS